MLILSTTREYLVGQGNAPLLKEDVSLLKGGFLTESMGKEEEYLRWQVLVGEQREASSFQTDLPLNLSHFLVKEEETLSIHRWERGQSPSCRRQLRGFSFPTQGSPGGRCPRSAHTSLGCLEN